jgi:hypothetical protein
MTLLLITGWFATLLLSYYGSLLLLRRTGLLEE